MAKPTKNDITQTILDYIPDVGEIYGRDIQKHLVEKGYKKMKDSTSFSSKMRELEDEKLVVGRNIKVPLGPYKGTQRWFKKK